MLGLVLVLGALLFGGALRVDQAAAQQALPEIITVTEDGASYFVRYSGGAVTKIPVATYDRWVAARGAAAEVVAGVQGASTNTAKAILSDEHLAQLGMTRNGAPTGGGVIQTIKTGTTGAAQKMRGEVVSTLGKVGKVGALNALGALSMGATAAQAGWWIGGQINNHILGQGVPAKPVAASCSGGNGGNWSLTPKTNGQTLLSPQIGNESDVVKMEGFGWQANGGDFCFGDQVHAADQPVEVRNVTGMKNYGDGPPYTQTVANIAMPGATIIWSKWMHYDVNNAFIPGGGYDIRYGAWIVPFEPTFPGSDAGVTMKGDTGTVAGNGQDADLGSPESMGNSGQLGAETLEAVAPGSNANADPDGNPDPDPTPEPSPAPSPSPDPSASASPAPTASPVPTPDTSGGHPGPDDMPDVELGPLEHALSCDKFPFGVPCWLKDVTAEWVGGGSAPSFPIPFPLVDPDPIMDLGFFDEGAAGSALACLRALLLLATTIATMRFLFSAATGAPGVAE